jgi:hypothetical protein
MTAGNVRTLFFNICLSKFECSGLKDSLGNMLGAGVGRVVQKHF